MKKVTLTTLILTGVALLCGALIGVAHFITGPIIEKNEEARANAVYQEYFEDLGSVETVENFEKGKYVYDILKVTDSNGKAQGYIFKGKDTNSFGLIDIIVVADNDGKIIGTRVLTNENTPGISDVHMNDDGTLKGVKGDEVTNLEGLVDDSQGASVTGGSIVAILREVRTLAPDYMDVEAVATPIEEMFGEGAVAEEDKSFAATEEVIKKEIVKDANGDVLGYAYTTTGLSDVKIPNKDYESITLLVGINLNGKAVGVIILESNHTPGFYDRYEGQLGSLVDVEVDDLEVDITDVGATASGNLINRLLNAVKAAVIEDFKSPAEKLYGEGAVSEVDETFEANDIVIKKEIVKDAEGNEIGYMYTGTSTTTEIPYADDAELTFLVAIQDGKVIAVIELVNGHTQSENFYLKYKDTIAGIEDVDVADLEIDKQAGASISYDEITKIFNAIKAVEAK